MKNKNRNCASSRGTHLLEPLTPLDIEGPKNIGDLLDSMAEASFGSRELGRAWSVLKKVVSNQECRLVLTISGAMTVAKMGRIFGSLISRSLVGAVITTGAVATHSLVEEIGLSHYKAPRNLSDEALYQLSLNRVYDSIEPESNLERLEIEVSKSLSNLKLGSAYGSFELIRHLSVMLLSQRRSKGLLGASLAADVNVYIPALTDSELGLYLFHHTRYSGTQKHKKIIYDPLRDLEAYAEWMCSQKSIAFLTIGGGVPRNWGQQLLPFLRSIRKKGQESKRDDLPKVIAAVRICPDPPVLGHLSGSSYSEGITWGKFAPENREDFVEVHCDATLLLPILVKALLDYIDQEK